LAGKGRVRDPAACRRAGRQDARVRGPVGGGGIKALVGSRSGCYIGILEIISAKGAGPMPTYSYECRKCGHAFQKILSFKEYEAGKVKCPKCGSGSVAQVLETFFAKTSRKS
jgi:putative FmdB family regulatory protein